MIFASDFLSTSGNFKWQLFTSSGTFIPSAELLAKGGNVLVLLVAGGGGGANASLYPYGAGGGGGEVKYQPFTVTGNTSVIIGAGGSIANNGGNSSFGSLICTGGQGALNYTGGTSGNGFTGGSLVSFDNCGNGIGGPGLYGYGYGGSGHVAFSGSAYLGAGGGGGAGGPGIPAGTTGSTIQCQTAQTPNSGNGGNNGQSGQAGRCLIMWIE